MSLRYEEPTELRIPMPWGHVAAKAWGQPGKTPVLGLHGWQDNAGTFDRLIPHLSNSMYFVAVDFPGHGLSSHLPPGIPYHFGDYLITIRRIGKFLKWNKFSIIGHSMGGAIGAFFASMYPQIVDKLVMLDIIKPISHDEATTADSMMTSIETFLSIEDKMKPETVPSYSFRDAMRILISATDESLSEDAAKCLMARGTMRVDEDKWTFRRDLRVRSPTIYRFSHQISMDFLRNISCHLLLIKAKAAPTFGGPPEVVKKTLDIYKEKCATFQYLEVEGNHFVHLNEPEVISEAVNSFLNTSPLSKSSL